MCTPRRRGLTVIGDDLSGTAEALGASLMGSGSGSGWVHLWLRTFRARLAHTDSADDARREAIDLDVRQATPSTARDRYAAALQPALSRDHSDVLLLKVDSLLRGNIAAALAAVPPAPHRPVLLAPALPAEGRRTVRGRVQLGENGTSLPGSLEGARVDVGAAACCPTALLGLDVVRADRRSLSTAMGRLAEEGTVAVCDAETDQDLDAVAAAAVQHRNPVVVGAGGVAAALGRVLRGDLTGRDPGSAGAVGGCSGPSGPSDPDGPVLVVVGTAEPGSRHQVVRLQQAGAVVRSVQPSDRGPAPDAVEALDRALRSGCAVLQVAHGPVDVDQSSRILERLADTAATVLTRQPSARVVLTGGATARAVLARLRVDTLRLQCQVQPGAAHLRTDDDRDIVTRPGSHGGPDSLAHLARHLGAPLLCQEPITSQTTAHQPTEGQT